MPDVLGINCGAGPGPSFDSLLRLTEAIKTLNLPEGRLTFSCLPNAGQPSLSGGRPVFMSKPHYCASYIEPYLRAGAKIVGGCCGTTPEHISAMNESLQRYQKELHSGQLLDQKQSTILYHADADHSEIVDNGAIIVQSVQNLKNPESEKPADKDKIKPKYKKLADHLRAIKTAGPGKDFFVSVEIDPPKGAGVKKLIQAADLLARAGADSINVGDSPMARVRMSSLSACQLISQNVGIDTIINFTTRDRNLMGMQADLLGCQALGLHNILALTGDPPALGNYAHATAVYDVDSIGLINIIAKLNAGQDIAGNTIGTPLTLSIGCALNPTAQNQGLELERIKRKIEAGADFIMTQPILSNDRSNRLFRKAGRLFRTDFDWRYAPAQLQTCRISA